MATPSPRADTVLVTFRCRRYGPLEGRVCQLAVRRRHATAAETVLRTYEGGPAGGLGTVTEAARAAQVPTSTATDWLIRAGLLRSNQQRSELGKRGGVAGVTERRESARRLYSTRPLLTIREVAFMVGEPWSTVRDWLEGSRYGLPSVLRPRGGVTAGPRAKALLARRARVQRLFHLEDRSVPALALAEGVSVPTIRLDLAHPSNPYRRRSSNAATELDAGASSAL